jgi:hypothetical protein
MGGQGQSDSPGCQRWHQQQDPSPGMGGRDRPSLRETASQPPARDQQEQRREDGNQPGDPSGRPRPGARGPRLPGEGRRPFRSAGIADRFGKGIPEPGGRDVRQAIGPCRGQGVGNPAGDHQAQGARRSSGTVWRLGAQLKVLAVEGLGTDPNRQSILSGSHRLDPDPGKVPEGLQHPLRGIDAQHAGPAATDIEDAQDQGQPCHRDSPRSRPQA